MSLNPNDHTAGGQLIVILSLLVGALVILWHADRERRKRGIPLSAVLWQRDLRLMKGAAVMMFGRVLDIAVFLPAWPLLSAGKDVAAADYAGSTPVAVIASLAAVITAIGVVILLWGWLLYWFKGWAFGVSLAFMVALFFFGAIANHCLGRV